MEKSKVNSKFTSGKAIVIVAPSGTGKSSLIQKLRLDIPLLEESISYTTRSRREGELEGVDYFFVDEKTFLRMKEDGEFVEWAKVHSHYYGTSGKFLREKLNDGHFVLLDLDVQGADSLKKILSDRAQIIFIEPPNVEELEKRLRGRGTDSPAIIEERLLNARKELLRKNDFDFLVLNLDFQTAFSDLKSIVIQILDGCQDLSP